jgi:hypothetical protein
MYKKEQASITENPEIMAGTIKNTDRLYLPVFRRVEKWKFSLKYEVGGNHNCAFHI